MSEESDVADNRPSIETNRLILRPFRLEDAEDVQRLAGDERVAATTASIPHPYPTGAAEEWIACHPAWFAKGFGVQFAIIEKTSGRLIGCIDLFGNSERHRRSELGYWVGVEFWNHGFCTEAAMAVIAYGFREMNLNKITSRHLGNNPASGRVMVKAGMKKEGVLRQEFCKDGRFHDLEVYGVLRDEWVG